MNPITYDTLFYDSNKTVFKNSILLFLNHVSTFPFTHSANNNQKPVIRFVRESHVDRNIFFPSVFWGETLFRAPQATHGRAQQNARLTPHILIDALYLFLSQLKTKAGSIWF